MARQLIAYVGDEESVFKESASTLAKIPGVGSVLANSIKSADVLSRAKDEINFINKHNIDVLYFTDDRYPYRLHVCEDAPLILYSRGNIDYNSLHIISVVGTRRPSDGGKQVCENIVDGLAQLFPDLIIVSGMAYGIDICAHRQSLKSGLNTIGVVAHGLDRIYPPMHRDVAAQMIERGAIITEFMSGTNPDRQNFVMRNRIIAGLSDATLVVESGAKGGALITADIAFSYQRDVLAVPGFPGMGASVGCNYLIKNNIAALVENADDVVKALNWEPEGRVAKVVQRALFPEFSNADEKQLFEMLVDDGESTASLMSSRSGLPVSKINAIMLGFEFSGWIKALPGGVFKIIK